MDKLSQINLKNTVTVQLSCNLNQEILIKNFGIIMDCLKDLNDKQLMFDKQLKDMLGLKEMMKQLNQRFNNSNGNNNFNKNENVNNNQNKLDKESINNINKNVTGGGDTSKGISHGNDKSNNNNNDFKKHQEFKQSSNDKKDLTGNQSLKNLEQRVTKNESNILDNIKDINVINKQIKQLKDLLNAMNNNAKDKGEHDRENKGLVFDINSIKNINEEMIKKQEKIDELIGQLQEMKKRIGKNQSDIADLKSKINQNNQNNNKINNLMNENNSSNSSNNNGNNQNLKNQIDSLKDKLNVLNQKLSNNILDTDKNTGDINYLMKENDQRKEDIQQNRQKIDILREQFNRFKEDFENMNNKLENDLKNLKNDVNKIKKQKEKQKQRGINDQSDKKHSNTSIDEDGSNFDKNSFTQQKFFANGDKNYGDAIKELKQRIDMIEKMLIGSKHHIHQQKNNPEKLPMIRRPIMSHKEKDHSHNKTHFPSNKKDLGQLKAEIQAWVKNYFQGGKQKDNLQSIQLQLQQLRNLLNKKADQQGMKKGLTFLQNKINQLYLFLTEPDTQDAMIVRKGFNCLSCSKKVQKLRGRLGPNINWNNLTTTNYSPPRVGYSRPMGQGSIDKDD